MKETQTIYVTLHDGKSIRVQIPKNITDEKAIQFKLNSLYGETGWKSYIIRDKNGK